MQQYPELPPAVRAALLAPKTTAPAAEPPQSEPEAQPNPADVAALIFTNVEDLDIGRSPIAAPEWDGRVMTFTNVEEPNRGSRVADPG